MYKPLFNYLHCCLCFNRLTFVECSDHPDGGKEDVCKPCKATEDNELHKKNAESCRKDKQAEEG